MPVFTVNEVKFDSDTGILHFASEHTRLDPKIAALLEYFITHPGAIFSRDELLDQVWKGAVVSDNTISWSVSQLRKALHDDSRNPRFIKTVAKRGYQFIADVSQPNHEQSTISVNSEPAPVRKRAYLVPQLVGALLLVVAMMVVFKDGLVTPATQLTSIAYSTPLVSLPGRERGGNLSADGLYLAFLHSPRGAATFQVYLKPLRDNRELPVASEDGGSTFKPSSRTVPAFALTQGGFAYYQVIWGEDDYQLFAVRQGEQGCEIVKLSLSLDRRSIAQTRKLHQCRSAARSKIAYSAPASRLYMVDAIKDPVRQDLFEYDLVSGSVLERRQASTDGRGFTFLDISGHDGQLLLLQDKALRETSFIRYHPASNELVTLFHVDSRYYTAYWSAQPGKIWLNWGNDTVLEYTIASDSSEVMLQTTVGWNYDFHPVSLSQAVYSVSTANAANLVFLKDEQSNPEITEYSEYLPTFAPNSGDMAYVSTRSGLPQIWLRRGTEDAQLTDVSDFYEFYDLTWTLDEKRLLGVTGTGISLIDLDVQSLQKLFEAKQKPFYPSLSGDDRYLLFSQYRGNQWHLQLHHLQPDKGQSTLVSEIAHAERGEFIDEHRFVFSRSDSTGLWIYDLQTQQTAKIDGSFPVFGYWHLANGSIIYSGGGVVYRCSILTLNRCSAPEQAQEIATIPDPLRGRFSFDASTNRVVVVDRRRTESNLRLANLN